MFFGLFKKQCPVCGMKVGKKEAVECCGKYFCSKECAATYGKKSDHQDHQEHADGGHGCCAGH